MTITGTPFDRHERGALQFSGGKDSLACVYLLKPWWDRLTVFHVDAGDLLPEVREIVDMVEGMVPDFRRINTDAAAWTHEAGLPSDLVPTSNTPAGMTMGLGSRSLVDRYTCCAANLMLPMHERMLADGVTLAIRGTKRADLPRLPAVSGDTSLGYELWLPLQDWSHDEVFTYLRAVDAPICRIYQYQVNSPECSTCPAWWSEGRAAYLSRYHPDLYETYQARLALVAAEVVPHWQLLIKEMSDGRRL